MYRPKDGCSKEISPVTCQGHISRGHIFSDKLTSLSGQTMQMSLLCLGVTPHFCTTPDGALCILSQEVSSFTNETPHCVHASSIFVRSPFTDLSSLSPSEIMKRRATSTVATRGIVIVFRALSLIHSICKALKEGDKSYCTCHSRDSRERTSGRNIMA